MEDPAPRGRDGARSLTGNDNRGGPARSELADHEDGGDIRSVRFERDPTHRPGCRPRRLKSSLTGGPDGADKRGPRHSGSCHVGCGAVPADADLDLRGGCRSRESYRKRPNHQRR